LASLIGRRRADECFSLSRRCSSRLTLVGCHEPPCAVGISRLFSERVMALNETRPFSWSSRIVEASALARASATCLLASPLLVLPLVIMPRRVSILPTEVRCQLPPSAVGTPLRFNSSVNFCWETKPPAISFRMVEAKAWARDSAARLFFKAARTPRFRDEAPPVTCSIGPSWLDLDVLS